MMVVESIRKALVPIHREGYPFIGIGVAVTLVLAFFSTSLAWIAGILTVWVCYFFRDPPRVTPVRDGLVVSPADGRVSLITTAVPPADLVALPQEPMTRISIFMNVFDCHVNRSPVPGRIVQAKYSPGLFLNAELDKASDDNERSSLVIETATGRVGVVQIAGLVARRIVSFVREGETLEVGQRFGLIRFGSRVDVYLPLGTQPLVGFGQIATAGETVLADLKAQEPTRLYRAG